jgi:ADP-heptose:LPS heptosyltransferase
MPKKINNECLNFLVLAGDMGIGNWIMLEPITRYFALQLGYRVIVVDFDGLTPLNYVNTLGYVERIVSFPNSYLTRGGGMIRRMFQIVYLWSQFRDIKRHCTTVFGRHTYSNRNLILGIVLGIKRSYLNVNYDDKYLTLYRLLGFNVRLYESEEHEVNNNIYLGRTIVGQKFEIDHFFFPEDESNLKSSLINIRNYVVLQATTGVVQPWKGWPKDYWMHLIQLLVNENINVLLVGSKEEYSSNQGLIESVEVNLSKEKANRITNISGKIDLSTLGALVKSSDCVVSADGLLGHVAACFGAKCISLLGPGGNGRRPLGVSIQYLQAKCDCNSNNSIDRHAQARIEKCQGKCMLRISPQDVFLRIKDGTQ